MFDILFLYCYSIFVKNVLHTTGRGENFMTHNKIITISIVLVILIVVAIILALFLVHIEGDERDESIKEKTIRDTVIMHMGYMSYFAVKEIYNMWKGIPAQTSIAPYFVSLGVTSFIFLLSYFFFRRKYS